MRTKKRWMAIAAVLTIGTCICWGALAFANVGDPAAHKAPEQIGREGLVAKIGPPATPAPNYVISRTASIPEEGDKESIAPERAEEQLEQLKHLEEYGKPMPEEESLSVASIAPVDSYPTVALRGACVGDKDINGAGTLSFTSMINTGWHDRRATAIYLASEFGCDGGEISGIRYYISTVTGRAMENFTIRMRHTTASAYTSPYCMSTADWTVCFQATVPQITTVGWYTFTFTTPFAFNGTDNVEVDVCFNNAGYTGGGAVWGFSAGTGINRAIYAYTDSGFGDPLNWTCGTGNPTIYGTTTVPRAQFIFPPPDFGACCYGSYPQTCADTDEAGCVALGGAYSPGQICAPGGTFYCPPWNDNCEAVTPVALTPGVPVQFNGTNLGATNQCPAFAGGHVWEAFSLPSTYPYWTVTLDYCGTVGPFGNAWLNLATTCPCSTNTAAGQFNTTACGDGNMTITWRGLAPGNYWYPVLLDPANNAAGPYTINVVANPGYCESRATSTADETIKQFILGSIDNTTTDCDTYDDFTHLSTNLPRGSTYPFTLVIGDCEGSSCYTKRVAIFVDWNQDNVFSVPGERVYLSGNLPNTPCPDYTVTGNITVPVDAALGATRIRVVVVETSSTDPTPCGTYTWGATEDYTAIIKPEYYLTVANGTAVEQGGSGYNSEWYLYPNNWWNIWWPNEFLLEGRKLVTIEFLIDFPVGEPPVVAFNYAREDWPNPDAPPLPVDDAFVVRLPVDPPVLAPGLYVRTVELPFCPLWVSMDVQGENFVVEGSIIHDCYPLGACCIGEICTQTTQAGCAGDWQGAGISCEPNPCELPFGACCFEDGHCEQLKEPFCTSAGGTSWTEGVDCDPNPCPQPEVACCYQDGSCLMQTAADCTAAGGAPGAYPSTCDPNPCPQPGEDCTNPVTATLGLADLPYEQLGKTNCGFVDDYDYASTTHCLYYYDSGEDILYNLTVTEAMDVTITLNPYTTTYAGVAIGNSCPPMDDCIAAAYGSAATPKVIGAQPNCLHLEPGDYYIMVDTWSTPDCIPNFDLKVEQCIIPTGACCVGDACTIETEADCLALSGTYVGTDVPCDPNPCVMGACCFWPSGDCQNLTETDCTTAGGNFNSGVYCAGITCPTPGDDCDEPIEVALPADLPYTDPNQTTCGRGNDYFDTCLGSYDGGEDIMYELVVTEPTCVSITATGNVTGNNWIGLAVDNACPLGNPCMYAATSSSGLVATLPNVALPAGTYYVMVDTYPAPNCLTDFTLTINASTGCVAGACCSDDGCEDNVFEAVCASTGGVFLGVGSTCSGLDCNANSIDDACDLGTGTSQDCNDNGIPDECDIAGGSSQDCQPNTIPDECELGDPVLYFYFAESFEGTFPPAGWENTALGDDGPWIVSTNLDYVRTGAQSAVHPWNATLSADSYLVTPELTLDDGILSVWSIGCFGQTWCDSYDIDVWFVLGAIGGGDDVHLGNLNDLWTDSFITWKEFTYDLDTLADGSPFRIGFEYTGLDGDLGVIDDVSIMQPGTPPLTNDCNLNTIPDDCDAEGDMNGDGTVDIADYPAFEACLAGPGAGMPACCGLADMDDDNDCDVDDFASYQQAF